MFLPKKFILANELVQKMDIHIANISIIRKELEEQGDSYTIQKLNNCNFVNTKSNKLPQNIRDGIRHNEFTDISNKLPVTYVRSEYPATERELMKSGIVTDKVKIAGKTFYVFADDFVNSVKGCLGYVLNEDEYLQCKSNSTIDGAIQLKNNKYFAWYKING